MNSVLKKEKQSECRGKFWDFVFSSFLTWAQQKDFLARKSVRRKGHSVIKKIVPRNTINEHIEANTPSQNSIYGPCMYIFGVTFNSFLQSVVSSPPNWTFEKSSRDIEIQVSKYKALGVNLHFHYSSI